MAVVNYYSLNGELIGDSECGDYLRDANGSVTGTVSHTTGLVENTYRYSAYGTLLSKTGTAPDPRFLWRGAQQYQTTSALVFAHGGTISTPIGSWTNESGRNGTSGSYTVSSGQLGKGGDRCGIDIPWSLLRPEPVHILPKIDFLPQQCGTVEFTTFWTLPPGVKGPGTIIQHVTGHRNHFSCKTEEQWHLDFNYAEAWPVSTSGKVHVLGFDSFNDKTGGEDCLLGHYSLRGKVGLYRCNIEDSGWRKGYFKFPGVPDGFLYYYGSNLNAGAPPGFIGGPSAKSVNYVYNCCVAQPGYKSQASFTPVVQYTSNKGVGWVGDVICKPKRKPGNGNEC